LYYIVIEVLVKEYEMNYKYSP